MRVDSVVKQVLVRLGIDERYNLNLLPKDDALIITIVRCFNMVANELASDYVEIRKIECVQATNKMVSYDSFSERLINVKKVEQNGVNVKYRLYPDFLMIEAEGQVDIEYCYLPSTVELDDEIMLTPRITELLMINGVLGEYCLINGRYEDSMLYDKRYREMIKLAIKPTHEIRLKQGGF